VCGRPRAALRRGARARAVESGGGITSEPGDKVVPRVGSDRGTRRPTPV